MIYQAAEEYISDYLKLIRACLARFKELNKLKFTDSKGIYTDKFVSSKEVADFFSKENNIIKTEYDFLIEDIRKEIKKNLDESMESSDFLPILELKRNFSLNEFELELIFAVSAPEFDFNFYNAYLFCFADALKKQPDISFIISLLSLNPKEKEKFLSFFVEENPLIRYRLLYLIKSREWMPETPFIYHILKVPNRIVEYLRGKKYPDNKDLEPAAFFVNSFEDIKNIYISEEVLQKTKEILKLIFVKKQKKGRILFYGKKGCGKKSIAKILGAEISKPVLFVNMEKIKDINDTDFEEEIFKYLREAKLQDCFLYLDSCDYFSNEEIYGRKLSILIKVLKPYPFIVFFGSIKPLASLFQRMDEVFFINIPAPSPEIQEKIWKNSFEGKTKLESQKIIKNIVQSYNLTGEAISLAAKDAFENAILRNYDSPVIKEIDIREALRRQIKHRVSEFAESISFAGNWDSLILKDATKQRLKEIVSSFRHQEKVMKEWGFGKKFSYGKGLSALFYGASGTGKTYAASIIAKDLGMELFRIELSRVLDKYIGETEKHLGRIFDEAEKGQVILLFDEADSLFSKRTEVRSSTDRYANIEVNYLLQRMESYEGVVILTTNYEALLDEGFKRRIRFKVYFPIPDEDERERLWMSMIPEEAEVASDVSFRNLARKYEMSGGHIKNAVLRAAFSAADKGEKITISHLVKAADIEYIELGKLVRTEKKEEL